MFTLHACQMVPFASRQVPGNLASFLKQASLDTAMAMLQPREATPPTPMARQLSGQGGGAVWPFGSPGMQHQLPMSPQPSPDHRLNSLNLQSSPLRYSCLEEIPSFTSSREVIKSSYVR